MDDIVVIILTLVVALFGILNSKKKKPDVQGPVGETANEPSDFWDLITDGVSADENEDVEYIEPVAQAFEVKATEEKTTKEFLADKEGISAIDRKILDKNKHLKTKKRTEIKKVMIEGEEFSLRKAVIYNEILNRKYS